MAQNMNMTLTNIFCIYHQYEKDAKNISKRLKRDISRHRQKSVKEKKTKEIAMLYI